MIGCIEENVSKFEGPSNKDDDLNTVTVSRNLVTAKFLDNRVEAIRPGVRKHKAGKLAESEQDIEDGQRLVAFGLQKSIESMAKKSISAINDKTDEEGSIVEKE